MINLSKCRFVVWGFKHPKNYHTHTHIHEAFYRALFSFADVSWLDDKSDLTGADFSDTFFISEHDAAKQGMPIRDDCFYAIHGLNNDPELLSRMTAIKNRLSWNVFHDYSHGNSTAWDGTQFNTLSEYYKFLNARTPDSNENVHRIWLGEDAPFYPEEKHMDFRWATDLLPHEIEFLKRDVSYTKDSRVINWVGSQWFVNKKELFGFKNACQDDGVEFKPVGAGQIGVVSIEDNIRLVRDSYFAPAIVGSHHIVEGYCPCRVFKNISYGQMGVTNSKRVNDIFGGKLIYNPDPYQLYFDAKEQLPSLPVSRIHELMDEVAKKHTYLHRLSVMMTAARVIMETK